ncbi:hypothetical protein IG631_14823 [Alternaria alternata]|nr:hypothetical protein IG631_14823 [Alternaria alternata]
MSYPDTNPWVILLNTVFSSGKVRLCWKARAKSVFYSRGKLFKQLAVHRTRGRITIKSLRSNELMVLAVRNTRWGRLQTSMARLTPHQTSGRLIRLFARTQLHGSGVVLDEVWCLYLTQG